MYICIGHQILYIVWLRFVYFLGQLLNSFPCSGGLVKEYTNQGMWVLVCNAMSGSVHA